uniref:[histone H3]-lysine(4) N-trimethyltransferase n=2 Tax=Macrostomum lignano TaxID=282301 RepID=A0A1I8H2I9_9PLAT
MPANKRKPSLTSAAGVRELVGLFPAGPPPAKRQRPQFLPDADTYDSVLLPPPPPPPPPPQFEQRSPEAETALNERILAGVMSAEEHEMLKQAFDLLVAEGGLPCAVETHWTDHPPVGQPARETGPREPHSTGCARSEGFYKLTGKQKERSALALAAAINAEAGQADEAEAEQEERKAKLSLTREARSMQRRILAEFADIEIGDLLKFNQLKFRKKKLKFDRSGIHSWGLFALETIAQDEMVVEYTGQIIRRSIAETREQAYERAGIGSSYLFRIDDAFVIDATKCGNNARFINHSCSPNCYAKVITVEGEKKIVIYSKREIRRNEEITYDYKFPYEEEKIICLCGTASCRGTLN